MDPIERLKAIYLASYFKERPLYVGVDFET